MRPHGRATVDPSNPRAWAICPRCRFQVNHSDLSWQTRWAGSRLINTGMLVCSRCLDVPNEQERVQIIPPDPVPIQNPRTETYDFSQVAIGHGQAFGFGAANAVPTPAPIEEVGSAAGLGEAAGSGASAALVAVDGSAAGTGTALAEGVEGTGTIVSADGTAAGTGAAAAVAPDPWLPSLLGATLRGWYKADALALANNDPVTTWADSSGNAFDLAQATGGNKPTYVTNVLNSLPAVRFDGSSDRLDLPDLLSAATAGAFFAVFKIDTDPPAGFATAGPILNNLSNIVSGTGMSHHPFSDGTIYDNFGTTARKTTVNPTPSLTSPRIYSAHSAASDWRNYLDGVNLFTTATNTTAFTGGGTRAVGWNSGAASFLDGDIHEIVICSAVLTSADRERMEGYLAHKWGLTASLAGGHPYKTTGPTGIYGSVGSAAGTGAAAAVTPEQPDPYFGNVVLLVGPTGVDAATATTDESSYAHTLTFSGNAQVDTGQSVFGSSLLFDGTGDYLSSVDSADWDFGANPFTVEFIIRFSSGIGSEEAFIGQWSGSTGTSAWFFYLTGNVLTFRFIATGGAIKDTTVAWTPTINTNYRLCAERGSGDKIRIYRDGAMVASATYAFTVNSTGVVADLMIGRLSGFASYDLTGCMEEIRITKGVARYDSDSGYTVATAKFPRTGTISAAGTAAGTGTANGANPWETTFSATLNADNASWSGYNMRQRIADPLLTLSGNAVRLTLQAAAATSGFSVSSMYLGHATSASDYYDFDGVPVQVLVGGSGSFSVAMGGSVVTDPVDYTFDETKTILISCYFNATSTLRFLSGTANLDTFYKNVADEASTSNVTGYTQTGFSLKMVSKIEVDRRPLGKASGTGTASGVSNAPWTPAAITGLVAWLEGDLLSGSDGDPLTSWPDSSGLGNNFGNTAGANRPTLQTAELDGKNVVGFALATTQYMYCTTAIFGAATAGTVMFVAKNVGDPPASGSHGSVLRTGTSGSGNHYPYTDGIIYDGQMSSSRFTVGDPTPSLANWHLGCMRSATNDWKYFLNGVQFYTNGTNTVGFATTPLLGVGDAGQSNPYNGMIAEVCFYAAALSSTDREKLEGYLAHKWGIESELDSGHPYKSAPP